MWEGLEIFNIFSKRKTEKENWNFHKTNNKLKNKKFPSIWTIYLGNVPIECGVLFLAKFRVAFRNEIRIAFANERRDFTAKHKSTST